MARWYVLLCLALVVAGCGKEPKKVYTTADLIKVARDDPNPDMRYWAARQLGKRTGPEARDVVTALVQVLRDPNEDVRAGAAYALANLGPQAAAALPELRKLTRDPSAKVREAATYALGRVNPKK
jgi:HEAT repeat protein